jgi:hypothetical protein
MFYQIKKSTLQERALKEIFRKEYEREMNFRKWICANFPPFSNTNERNQYGFIFPFISEVKFVGEVDRQVWTENRFYKKFYFPNIETDEGMAMYQRIYEHRGQPYDTSNLYSFFELDNEKYHAYPTALYEINNTIYVYFNGPIEQVFIDKWSEIAYPELDVWVTQKLASCDYGLPRSNVSGYFRFNK